MWPSAYLTYILTFVAKISEKSYKALTLFLTSVFLVTSIIIIDKVNTIGKAVEIISSNAKKNDSVLEARLSDKMNKMYLDASVLFSGFAESNQKDLITIIENSNISIDKVNILKRVLERTTEDLKQEFDKNRYQYQYLPSPQLLDSVKIRIRKVSLNDSLLNVPFYYVSY